VILTIAVDGSLRIDRGYVRAEDEPKHEPVTPTQDDEAQEGTKVEDGATEVESGSTVTPFRPAPEPEDKAPALSAILLAELEAHRTAGLQASLGWQPELALRVMVHALATDPFYSRYGETVLALHTYPPALAAACPGIADNSARQALCEAEDAWRTRLPREHGAFWGWLQDQDVQTLLSLTAVCMARATNAGPRTWTTSEGRQCIAAQVATAARLDMRMCWTATKDSYLGRVPKALIVEAVREGVGVRAAGQIVGSKKEVMVADVEQLLAETGWLPSILRVSKTTYPLDSADIDSLTIPQKPIAAE
jgi:ParB family chromosome partitioning protein